MKNILLIWLMVFLVTSVTAAPLTRNDVPEPLRPWIDWVLHGEKNESCPIVYNSADHTICAWPSFLKLDVQQSTAIFSQQWRVYANDVWLILPGSATLWPQEVMVNGTTIPVGERNGRPAVYATTPGEYSVNGVFSFDRSACLNRPALSACPLTVKRFLFPDSTRRAGSGSVRRGIRSRKPKAGKTGFSSRFIA